MLDWCSDIVYKLENEPVYFFVEHQSNKDESINYRIFNYYSLLLYDTIDFQKIKHKDYKFPIIVPVLLYTGKNKWNLVPNVGDKQTNYDLLNNKKINLYYDFIDIHNYTSKELLDSNSTIAYIMATDKCKDEKDLYSILTKLSEIHLTNEQKETIQRFIFFIYNKYFSKDTKNQLISKFNKKEDIKMSVLLDDVSSNMKTTLRDGISKGISSVVKKMLNNGESTEKIILYTGYSKKQIEKIKHEIGLI